MNETIPYLPGLSPVAGKELCARFDGGRLSSDGGVLLLPGIERRLGIAALLASCVTDARDPASTTHGYADMIRARMFAIARGYEDCDDLDAPRPGKRPSAEEAAGVLKHVIGRIRSNWPRVGITVRGDGHYGTPEVMEFVEDHGCGYIFGLPGNARLSKIGQPWREDAAVRRARSAKDKVRRFFQTGYRAKSWSRERTVIARVEATSKGTDIRFVVRIARLRHDVTNLPGRAKALHEKIYCARGRMDNMIKAHQLYTESDRTSCHRWEANQFRLFLHSGAYWLLHRLRQAAPRRSRWRKATFETLRRAFLKIAARIEELKSRVRVALPSAYPYRQVLISMAGRITAQGP